MAALASYTGDLVAVVLAAGAASRMGESKAALVWKGRTFLAHCVELAARAIGDDEAIIVVEGAHPLGTLLAAATAAPRLGSGADRPSKLTARQGQVSRVVNPSWHDGPLSSLQRALAHPRASSRACLVLSVDRPHLDPNTVADLVRSFRDDPHRIVQPQFEGRSGHPIIWPADLCKRLNSLDPRATPRELLREASVRARRVYLPVDDPAVVDNIDDPEALAALRALTPS